MNTSTHTPAARDFMIKNVVTVQSSDSLRQVVKKLLKHRISNVPVVEGPNQRLVGFLSEADCIEQISNELFYGTAPQLTAGQLMKRHPVCVAPDANVFAVASILSSHRMRHLPVVEQDRLIGIVSRHDVLGALEHVYTAVTDEREHVYNPPDLHEIINHRLLAEQSSL